MSESLYSTLETTAKSFVKSCNPTQPGGNTVDSALILSHTIPTFVMDYGHSHFVSTFPPLQKALSGPEWQQHMLGMTSNLRTWDIQITDLVVDEGRKKAVVRGDFHMFVKGYEDAVVNEIILMLRMEGSGGKVEGCTEFIDAVAGQELGRRMATVGK
ncbi:hypothetical protein M409DRAFT_17747 [Zasmidium cellare ATCC 36951]|uniref:SnoaL-like domain-containing protein n=1 Tax=Zasmidium cellare ATCC 36951 TaxID=1080233 RepID=A0A6A6CZD2_ZASCE|nr:uncharacterized protein M409DRAFT_17747 [Zasmidium cellare ATCC 36951]KAF2172514.1 hypothetical protein M409DRAFT_17747 [Zasmidium cellare ATCC 36951]